MKIYIERSEMTRVVVRKVLTLDTENLRNAFSVFAKMTDEEILKEIDTNRIPAMTNEGDEFDLCECMCDEEYIAKEEGQLGTDGFSMHVTNKIDRLVTHPSLVKTAPTYKFYVSNVLDNEEEINY